MTTHLSLSPMTAQWLGRRIPHRRIAFGPFPQALHSSAELPATCSGLAERARRGVSFFTALD